MAEFKAVGASVPRAEAGDKVSGQYDLCRRCEAARAALGENLAQSASARADSSASILARRRKLPGVKAIITGADVRGLSGRQADSRHAGAVLGQSALRRRPGGGGGGGDRGCRRGSHSIDRRRLRNSSRGVRSAGSDGAGRAAAPRQRRRVRWRAEKYSRRRSAQRSHALSVEERRYRARFPRRRSGIRTHLQYSGAPSRLPRTARGDRGDRTGRPRTSLGRGEKSLRRAQPVIQMLGFARRAHPHERRQRRRRIRRQGRRCRSCRSCIFSRRKPDGR